MTKTKKQTINLQNLEISDKNQRFDSNWNIEENLIEYIQSGNQNYLNNENKIVLQLLKYEGDFKNFYDLVFSIAKQFKSYIDDIYVIPKKKIW